MSASPSRLPPAQRLDRLGGDGIDRQRLDGSAPGLDSGPWLLSSVGLAAPNPPLDRLKLALGDRSEGRRCAAPTQPADTVSP